MLRPHIIYFLRGFVFMKKVITGAAVLLTGAMLFLSTFVAASGMGLIGGWSESGRFWAAMSENKLISVVVISIIVMIAGITIMVWGNMRKSD